MFHAGVLFLLHDCSLARLQAQHSPCCVMHYVCLSICLSHSCIVSKWVNIFFTVL